MIRVGLPLRLECCAVPAPSAGCGHCCSSLRGQASQTSTTVPHKVCGLVVLFSCWARPTLRRVYSRRSRVKCGSRTDGKGDEAAWVAPTVQAKGTPGGNVALGAIQQLEDGSALLHGQVYDEARNSWSPVLLKRIGLTDTWQSEELALELAFGKIAKLALHRDRGSLEEELPSWPANLRRCLEAWPLKGPGSVILDPHFFVQRAAALALLGPGPVLFPNGAAAMSLPSLSCIHAFEEEINGRSLRSLLCPSAENLEDFLSEMPASLSSAHFDVAAALGSDKMAGFVIVLQEKPLGLECESLSWTCGAVLRRVEPGTEAEKTGCRVGDLIVKIGDSEVLQKPFDDIQDLLAGPDPITLTLSRPKLSDKIYLREVPAADDALSSLSSMHLSLQDLVPRLSQHFGTNYLYFSEQTPMLFAGDGGTASHLHIDRKPLMQFCHVLHGTKVFCVSPPPGGKAEGGPVVPWEANATSHEAVLSTDTELPAEAGEWLQRKDVTLTVVRPGDVFLFLGRSLHAGCNGASEACVAVFHGAQPISYMAQGAFGPAYQVLARQILSR
eukprot:s720_g5.t1